MREIKAQKLDMKKFAPFGYFADMVKPEGEKVGDAPILFYRDMLQFPLGQTNIASFSIVQVEKRDPVVDTSEYHATVGEGILPLDCDVVIHVAPATPTADVPVDRIEAFVVPQGTMVVLKPGVWHHAPLTVNTDQANVLIVLPERTYANDCIVRELPPDQQVKIEMP